MPADGTAFDGLLPASAVLIEAGAAFWDGELLPEERACVARAVPQRVREFAAGRQCARRALALLGCPPAPLLVGSAREPLFPAGIAGSITHTRTYCAAAVLRIGEWVSLGIDAEPDAPLEPALLPAIADAAERAMLEGLAARAPLHAWDRLLFCIKEAFFKAYFPIGRRFIDFHAASVTIDATGRSFEIGLRSSEVEYFRARRCRGAYAFRRGLLLAALALPAVSSGRSAGDRAARAG